MLSSILSMVERTSPGYFLFLFFTMYAESWAHIFAPFTCMHIETPTMDYGLISVGSTQHMIKLWYCVGQ